MNETIKICDKHEGTPTPLLFTFAFPRAEYWCSHCGHTAGIMGAGNNIKATKELIEKQEKLKKSKEDGIIGEYLHANAILYCLETKWKGKWIEPQELPQKEKDRLKRLRDDTTYPIAYE